MSFYNCTSTLTILFLLAWVNCFSLSTFIFFFSLENHVSIYVVVEWHKIVELVINFYRKKKKKTKHNIAHVSFQEYWQWHFSLKSVCLDLFVVSTLTYVFLIVHLLHVNARLLLVLVTAKNNCFYIYLTHICIYLIWNKEIKLTLHSYEKQLSIHSSYLCPFL